MKWRAIRSTEEVQISSNVVIPSKVDNLRAFIRIAKPWTNMTREDASGEYSTTRAAREETVELAFSDPAPAYIEVEEESEGRAGGTCMGCGGGEWNNIV